MLLWFLAAVVISCEGELLHTKVPTETDLVPLSPLDHSLFQPSEYGTRNRRSVKAAPTSNRCHKVSKIPRGMASRYRLNTTFYGKYTSSYGIPIMSSSFVDNRALQRACYVVRVMLSDRKDLRDHLFFNKGRITVMAKNQTVPMIPEMWRYTNWIGRAVGGTFQNPVSIIGEEHLLCGNDIYSESQDVLVHEVAHAIHTIAAQTADPDIDFHITRSFESAKSAGLWNNTYANTDHLEYFAEGVQAYYNVQREGSVGGDGIHNNINTASELRKYDLSLYKVIKSVFPCKNRIIPRCEDLSQKRGLKQILRMDCRYSELPPAPRGTCKDDNWSCPSWAEVGECSNNPKYMLKSCRRSCSVCSEGQEGSEVNIFNSTGTAFEATTPSVREECADGHKDCKKWKMHCSTLPHINNLCKSTCNSCSSSETINFHVETTIDPTADSLGCIDNFKKCKKWQTVCLTSSFVQTNCKLTCRLCEFTETTASLPDSTTSTRAAIDTEKKCVDNDVNCHFWRSYCNEGYVRMNCKLTCDLCMPDDTRELGTQVEEELDCNDLDENCPTWTSYCHKRYAKRNCKLTCGICGSAREETEQRASKGKAYEGCVDNDDNCASWTDHCLSSRYVIRNCKRTCNSCRSDEELLSTSSAGTDAAVQTRSRGFHNRSPKSQSSRSG